MEAWIQRLHIACSQDGGVETELLLLIACSQDGGVDTEVTHSVQSGWRRGNRGYS